MINYADYDFYLDEYQGSLSDDLFYSLIPKASREIDKAVNRELKEVDITNKVKYVACELVDFLNSTVLENKNGVVSSMSIDGVSKSFRTETKQENLIAKKEILNGLPHDLIRFL